MYSTSFLGPFSLRVMRRYKLLDLGAKSYFVPGRGYVLWPYAWWEFRLQRNGTSRRLTGSRASLFVEYYSWDTSDAGSNGIDPDIQLLYLLKW